MKPVNRIFLILGAMSMFSLFQFDAMGSRNDCTGDVDAGLYCKNWGNKPRCPAGCYCPGGVKRAVGTSHDANFACTNRTPGAEEKWMNDSGIYYCPSDYPHSNKSSSTIWDCFDGSGNHYVAPPVTYTAGKYVYRRMGIGHAEDDCPKGCYCEGGAVEGTQPFERFKTKLESFCKGDLSVIESGQERIMIKGAKIFVCPDGKTSKTGAKNVGDCYDSVVNYVCNDHSGVYGSGTGPTDPKKYAVGEQVTLLAKGDCVASTEKPEFDGWYCLPEVGNKHPGETFQMPDATVFCWAKWKSAGNNGGGTQGGGSHSCQPGQYWKSGLVDITAEARAVPIAVLRDTAQANTTRSAKKAATKSVVSRTAMQPLPVSTFNVSMAKTLDAADLRLALGGSCTDCEAGYYCPGGTQGRVACPEGKYTNTTGQTQCLVCNGIVIQTGNLNTGCSTDPDNPGNNYNVTYNCGDHGTGDLSNNGASHTSGTQVTTLASTACARNEGYTFSNWECMAGSIELSVNNAGQFTMPDADVTCTAQWSTGSNGNGGGGNGNENEDAVCPVGQYLPADGEDADDCEQCSGNYVCPGDDASYPCPWTVSGNTCGGILDAGQLKKGKSRNRDCWKFFNSPSDYRECVYGFSID